MTPTCRFCGDTIAEHQPMAHSRGHCAKSRCIAAAVYPSIPTGPTPGSDPTPGSCWICGTAPKTDGTATCTQCRDRIAATV